MSEELSQEYIDKTRQTELAAGFNSAEAMTTNWIAGCGLQMAIDRAFHEQQAIESNLEVHAIDPRRAFWLQGMWDGITEFLRRHTTSAKSKWMDEPSTGGLTLGADHA